MQQQNMIAQKIAGSPPAGLAVRQSSAEILNDATANPVTASLPSSVVANSLLVLVVGSFEDKITGITVDGAALTLAVKQIDSGFNSAEVWYRENVAAGPGAISISLASNDFITGWATEVTGAVTSSALDRTGTAGSGSTVTASAANTQANEIVFVAQTTDSGANPIGWNTPSGYTLVGNENNSVDHTGTQSVYKIVSTIETSSCTVSTTSGIDVDQALATFKGA